MAYVDYEYYSEVFKGKLESSEIDKLLEEASDDVDKLSFGRIRHRGFENLTEFQQDRVKKAVCYQAEFINTYGGYISSPLGGYSIGDVSLSFGEDNQGADGTVADKKTLSYLSQTGLSSRRL